MLGGEGGGWEAIHFRVTKQLLCSLGLFFFLVMPQHAGS